VAALYDERFVRMWEFYLAASEVGFRYETSMVFQMQLARTRDAVPLRRDYVTEFEQARSERPAAAAEWPVGRGSMIHARTY
jgi:cyclopropane-fatty-acyl-phospholipid synthase